MRLKKLLVAAAAVSATGLASADPTVIADWGEHDPGELGGVAIYSAGALPIDHVFTFSLSTLSDLFAVAVSNDAPPVFNLTDGAVELFASNGDDDYTNDTSLGSFDFDSSAVSSSFSNVVSGDYFYRVTGVIDGNFGGSYLLSSAATPVPEPETYALMLAGLGALAFLGRRRKQG